MRPTASPSPTPARSIGPVAASPESTGFTDLSIVVPALNEGRHVKELLERIRDAFPQAELLLVDNGSTDDTLEQARQVAGVILVNAPRRGKGLAMVAGVEQARNDLILFHDADLEYDPKDALALIEALRRDPSCMAVGVRTASFGGPPWSSLFANALIRRLMAWRFGANRTRGLDVLTGTRALSRRTLNSLHLDAPDFRIETQLVRKALQLHVPLRMHPIRYEPRGRLEGKKIRARHLLGLLKEALRA